MYEEEGVPSESPMKTLAERLIWARERKGLTKTQVAAEAGVTSSSISHLETGLRKSSRNILQIARVLGVDPGWLNEGRGSPEPRAEAPRLASESKMQLVYVTRQEQDLLTSFREADEVGQDFILKAAQAGASSNLSEKLKKNG